MNALGWFPFGLMALATLISVSIAWHASPPVDLRGILARLALSLHARLVPDYGRHSGIPVPVIAGELVVALPAAQVAAHADAMHAASAEFLPELPPADDRYDWMAAQPQPRGRHARPVPLTEQVIPTMRVGTQPWDTASFAAQPDEPAPADEPTDEQTRDLYHGGDWGTRPQLAAGAEAGAQPVMLP